MNTPFDAALEVLEQAGGVTMAKRQAEEVAVYLSQDLDAFYAQSFVPQEPNESSERLLICICIR